ncbi:bifunctional 4-hydroxy-2-oxoglutarate aldolase/2-dehydro-3-deoxy-phosphogluconate aldolase [Bacillus sp. FJAT-49705]|uniref:Bifunctional 4-hydroxy-2-oxoglutarate aldolase/2-dehydro-3-deoxy-phosphogluconate aldolase n=1 Tax=Cytobacillus citreus TaxID=2833586 RepID=A0ABS5NY91_9BACI|nr:bifunctional 4-hydroxy-2-oxoglutarate aldolase/2-dehydro-3-deoxy-phosphogluconate aldolase [Cytobacillus citreus]
MTILSTLLKEGLIAVIRESTMENVIPICEALYEGGIKVVEITAETPQLVPIIEKTVDNMGDKILVGAGTVLDPETARMVISAGAHFVVSPTVNIDTIRLVKRYGVVCIQGALTPTEIVTAYENGADMVKIFPINAFGPSYVKNIHGPLPQIPLMVTGGINLDNVSEYVNNGASGIGIGSNLVNVKKLNTQADYETLLKKTKQYVQAYHEASENEKL